MTESQQLAELIHEKTCKSHEKFDFYIHCDWNLNDWSSPGLSRERYLHKANRILKIVNLDTAEKIINIL